MLLIIVKLVMSYIKSWFNVLSHARSGHHEDFIDLDSYKFVHLDILARIHMFVSDTYVH